MYVYVYIYIYIICRLLVYLGSLHTFICIGLYISYRQTTLTGTPLGEYLNKWANILIELVVGGWNTILILVISNNAHGLN